MKEEMMRRQDWFCGDGQNSDRLRAFLIKGQSTQTFRAIWFLETRNGVANNTLLHCNHFILRHVEAFPPKDKKLQFSFLYPILLQTSSYLVYYNELFNCLVSLIVSLMAGRIFYLFLYPWKLESLCVQPLVHDRPSINIC